MRERWEPLNLPLTESKDYFRRLGEPNGSIVRRIIGEVSQVAEEFNEQDVERPNGFFAIYAIGGQVTKPDLRPDIDLLIVSNAWFDQGYYAPADYDSENDPEFEFQHNTLDWIGGSLFHLLHGKDHILQFVQNIPDAYTQGAAPKALIRATPLPNGASSGVLPIDIVYIRTPFTELGQGDGSILSLADFEKLDVDEHGNPLPKIELFRAENLGRQIQYRL